jgi:ubiquinone biosynthesis protein UbiJ
VLIRPGEVDAFGADVVRLRDDVERTAKRVARLEQLLKQAPIPTTRPSGDPTLDS